MNFYSFVLEVMHLRLTGNSFSRESSFRGSLNVSYGDLCICRTNWNRMSDMLKWPKKRIRESERKINFWNIQLTTTPKAHIWHELKSSSWTPTVSRIFRSMKMFLVNRYTPEKMWFRPIGEEIIQHIVNTSFVVAMKANKNRKLKVRKFYNKSCLSFIHVPLLLILVTHSPWEFVISVKAQQVGQMIPRFSENEMMDDCLPFVVLFVDGDCDINKERGEKSIKNFPYTHSHVTAINYFFLLFLWRISSFSDKMSTKVRILFSPQYRILDSSVKKMRQNARDL